MKRFLRITAGMMTLVILMTWLVGCSKPDTVKTENQSTGKPADTAKEQSKDEKKEDTKEQTAAPAEPVVIKAVIKDMSPDDEVSVTFLKHVSEGVSKMLGQNVTIELVPISEGTYSESVGLLLQSGNIPDLIYFQGGDYQFAITQQILENLNPYIEKSEYIKKMLQPSNAERLKNYPYLLWLSPDRIKVPVVREDWLNATESGKKLLEDPSPENYKAFFREIKEKNKAKAAYTVPGNIAELDTVFNAAFGVNTTWVKQGDSYVYSKITDGEKNKLAFYASLYKEGLFDNEWLSKKWDTKEQAFYTGEVAVVAGTEGAVVNIYNSKMIKQNGETAKLVVLPPAKGLGQSYTSSNVSKESRGWAISAYSEHKEQAFAILEYMASPEGQILDKLGYEGEQHKLEDGVYTLTDKISEWYARFHESTAAFDVKFNPQTPFFSEPAENSLNMVSKYLSFDNAFVIPGDYITNWDAGQSLYLEYAADVISGKKSIDTFDDFVTEWTQTVGPEITEYANKNIK
ncbi:extracellular solute-binding protein [Clostridiales bacterium COT073_COT-073]|nr:extracellular solute-binding protein [Clostridiales bacterium COT073_COT-073]